MYSPILAVISNVAMSFAGSIPLMAVVWFINGYAHAMLWPPMVRLMATSMNDIEYSYSAVRISCGSSGATIALYLITPLLLGFMSWNNVILSIAVVGAIITVSFVVAFPKLFADKNDEEDIKAGDKKKTENGVPLPKGVFVSIVLIIIAIALQGALRDGVGDWMPTFMADAFGLKPENAIIAGVIPAIFSMLSFYMFDKIYRRYFKNEISCAAFIFIGAAVSSALLLLLNALSLSGVVFAAVSAFLIGFLIACMHGVNLMLITVVPKRFIKSGKVSTFSGLFNSATYIGAAIALPLFPALKSNFSWGVTIAVWGAISVAGAAVCFLTAPSWRRFKENYSDNPEI